MSDKPKRQLSASERDALANIPASALADMGQVHYDARADLGAYSMAAGGPQPMSPRSRPSDQVSTPPPNTTGWQAERPLGPQPGINVIDAMCISADQRERAQAQAPDMMMQMAQALMMMQQMQTSTLAILAQIVANQESAPAKPGAKKP